MLAQPPWPLSQRGGDFRPPWGNPVDLSQAFSHRSLPSCPLWYNEAGRDLVGAEGVAPAALQVSKMAHAEVWKWEASLKAMEDDQLQLKGHSWLTGAQRPRGRARALQWPSCVA